jgi:hypothetical protein
MFIANKWPERGSKMITAVQARVAETYGSVEQFIKVHATQTPEEFRNGLPSLAEIGVGAAEVEQRDFMRELVKKHGLDKEIVCAAFAEALKSGLV